MSKVVHVGENIIGFVREFWVEFLEVNHFQEWPQGVSYGSYYFDVKCYEQRQNTCIGEKSFCKGLCMLEFSRNVNYWSILLASTLIGQVVLDWIEGLKELDNIDERVNSKEEFCEVSF